MTDADFLARLARRIREHVLRMTHAGRGSHVGSNLSVADVLAALYGHALRVAPSRPNWPDRDRFILSKGHAAASLYAVLAERGFFPLEWLANYYQDGSRLCGHVSGHGVPGIDASTGSLGHGLSLGAGMALVGQRDSRPYRVFVVLSDGECDEGSMWEPVLFAAHHHLDNLIAVIDYNKIQSLDFVERTLALEPLAEKWRSFGWAVREVDGHDVQALAATLDQVPFDRKRPSCLVAHTVKGKGVSFMENQVLWHYRPPSVEELASALAELGAP